MRLLITDLTEMGAGNFCVAGWDAVAGRMVRPLPNSGNWPTSLITAYQIRPGAEIEFTPTGKAHTGQFPHTTEDTPIVSKSIKRLPDPPNTWLAAGAPVTAMTVRKAFANNVSWNSEFNGRRQGVHVAVNSKCSSLAGLKCHTGSFRFVEEFDKLKAVITDSDSDYIVSVSAAYLKVAFRTGGLKAAQGLLPSNSGLHVRLGLAREFSGQPGKCSMMLNGVYW